MGVKIRQLRGKKWYVVIDHQGRRKTKCVGTKGAAAAVRRKIEERLALGDMGVLAAADSERVTFEPYSEKCLQEARNLKSSSVENYRQYLRLFVQPTFGKSEITKIHRAAVKTWLGELAGKKLARNTVRLALCAFRIVMSHAVEDELAWASSRRPRSRNVKRLR
jgi:hypothetical protein